MALPDGNLRSCHACSAHIPVAQPLSEPLRSRCSRSALLQQAHAQDKVLKVGTLKLIHGITAYFYEKFAPPGYKVEVIPFESPTDGKNAVITGTVDPPCTASPPPCSALPRASRS